MRKSSHKDARLRKDDYVCSSKNPEGKRQWEREASRKTKHYAENAALEREVGMPEYSKASARPWFGSKTASHLENDSWLGGRHRNRAACGDRRSRIDAL